MPTTGEFVGRGDPPVRIRVKDIVVKKKCLCMCERDESKRAACDGRDTTEPKTSWMELTGCTATFCPVEVSSTSMVDAIVNNAMIMKYCIKMRFIL
eukprot:scaffold6717_cov160-Amphora_coffeaeformis.AAC.3